MSSELIERLRRGVPFRPIPMPEDPMPNTGYAEPDLSATVALLVEAAATIAQLQAELAEAQKVPGRIVAWLIGGEAMGMGRSEIIDAIEARDWSKP